MIERFNEVEARSSGVVYASMLDQIKKMYAVDPERAGELAISTIEMILTDQISSDDVMIEMLLIPSKAINDNNVNKYNLKVENSRQKKIREMKLAEIAELVEKGYKQREIGERLNLSQQIVSYRIGMIRSSYPELLSSNGEENTNILQKNYKNTNKIQTLYKENTNEVQTTYKNTKVQKDDFCKVGKICEEEKRYEISTKDPSGNKTFIF